MHETYFSNPQIILIFNYGEKQLLHTNMHLNIKIQRENILYILNQYICVLTRVPSTQYN